MARKYTLSRARPNELVSVNFDMFIDRAHVMNRMTVKEQKVYRRTGLFTMRKMRQFIRKRPKQKRDRTVVVSGTRVFVPHFGKVVLAKDMMTRVSKAMADKAREIVGRRIAQKEHGRPPRRGIDDTLRRFILFGISLEKHTVLIGPHIFDSQQAGLVGVKDTPALLEFGGAVKKRSGVTWHYAPRPYVFPRLPFAEQTFARELENTPLE